MFQTRNFHLQKIFRLFIVLPEVLPSRDAPEISTTCAKQASKKLVDTKIVCRIYYLCTVNYILPKVSWLNRPI